MGSRQKIKIAIDFGMTAALLLLMPYGLIGEKAHEWIGTAMFLLFLSHHVLNRKWILGICKGTYMPYRILQTAVTISVFITMIMQMVSGVLLSRYVFTFLPPVSGMELARALHIAGAYWGFIFMSLHLGLHWSMIAGMAKRAMGKEKRFPDIALRMLAVAVSIYGIYAFHAREFADYLLLRTHFAFLDFDEPVMYFLLDYMAVMVLFALIGHYLSLWLRKVYQKDKKHISAGGGVFAFVFILPIFLTACAVDPEVDKNGSRQETNESFGKLEDVEVNGTEGKAAMTGKRFPQELIEIPQEYAVDASKKGELLDLYYDTYESRTYEEKSKKLTKHAVVYIPYGYSEDERYNVFYLMHGGWSNETTYLGTPEEPSAFKNILDHAMEDGAMQPMIIVCPTYNNESGSDSGDYSLALELTDNYHNELIGDLIPAVEGTYSTYAETTSREGIQASRDHRAFCGFSMGSVATWHTFEYCLDYFRYFMPSSGNLTSDGEYMASIVRDSGHTWNDFFIFAASGTEDFAYSAFKQQIEAMRDTGDGIFRFADNETEGNLYFLEKEGGIHSGEYALLYIYNGLCWIWN